MHTISKLKNPIVIEHYEALPCSILLNIPKFNKHTIKLWWNTDEYYCVMEALVGEQLYNDLVAY